MMGTADRKLLFVVTEDWYFWSHRLPVARAARDAGWIVHVATRVSAHRALIESERFLVEDLEFDRSGLNPIRDSKTLWRLIRLYIKLRPTLVHHIAAKPVLYGTIAAWLCRVPAVVNTMAGLGFLFSGRGLKTRVAKFMFMRMLVRLGNSKKRTLIVQNTDDRQTFLDAGLVERNVSLIRGSGVNLKQFAVRDEPGGVPIAICVARMLRDKGIGELVDAARLLHQRRIPLRIRLVGGTDLNPSSIAPDTLSEWSQEGIVDLVGHSNDIASEYARAHIAVLPSYREGLPKSLLEAAACGRPIVATDVPGCREICIPNETGILVPAKEAGALADALQTLAADPSLRLKFGRRARILVETLFSDDIVAAETLAVYQSLLSH